MADSHKPTSNTDSWENEGGSLTPEQAAKELGLIQSMTESFSAGGNRYSSLMHAIGYARRMRGTGRSS